MRPVTLACVALLILAASGVGAEQSVFDFPLTAANRPALAAVCNRVAPDPVVKGDFTQVKRLSRLSKSFTSRGRFVFAVDRGIIWDVRTPFPSTTIITRDRLVQRAPDGSASTLDGSANPVFRRFADTMQAVFAGNLPFIEEQFSISFQSRGDSGWRLGLLPKDSAIRGIISSMEISGDEHVRDVLLTEASKDTVQYTFSDVQTPGALTPDEEHLFP